MACALVTAPAGTLGRFLSVRRALSARDSSMLRSFGRRRMKQIRKRKILHVF
jgi:hypothetical protein